MNFPWHHSKPISSEFDIKSFKELIQRIKDGNKTFKIDEISKVLSFDGLLIHYKHKITQRIVVANCKTFEYAHEHHTSKKLTGENYDVVLVPKGYFKRNDKKFDVFICRGHILLEADLKCITSTNPDTIANRIKEGSEQSSRLVLDIHSTMPRKDLIDGLKSGCEKNNGLKEIMLFYMSRFYCLPATQILSKRIYDVIK